MNRIPFIPENAPFTPEQRLWLNGYLAGVFSDATAHLGAGFAQAPAAPLRPLTILFGSQTGTAEGLAKKTAAQARTHGFDPKILCMDKLQGPELAAQETLLLITSTYGDGEPPDNAQAFWNFLKSDSAPALASLSFSVLALGDTNYAGFCEFGKVCDARLEQLGARRIAPRIDCDVDYEAPARTWTETVFAALGLGAAAAPAAEPAPALLVEGFSKKKPFPGRLVTNRLLNAAGSGKEVRHFEISLEGSGLAYEAGDALGVLPANCPALVDNILAALGCDGEEAVPGTDGTLTALRVALIEQYDLGRPSSDFLAEAARRTPGGEWTGLLDPARREDLKKFLWGREIFDFLPGMSERFKPAELVAKLKKLQPRLYSISSSPKAHPGQVHLTVAAVRYEAHGRARKGVCSTFLADRAGDSTAVPVFVQVSHGFRLPADPTVPIIMVGPGTGIAPFRAFLEERRATGALGRNWLFFGDQKRATDFLYQEELEAMQTGGHLSRLDLAFSRDQEEKIYVQTRMLENAAELWAWLQAGAHFYVCGDAARMAKDVDAALHTIAQTAGNLTPEDAAAYLARLKSEKRYQRDVY